MADDVSGLLGLAATGAEQAELITERNGEWLAAIERLNARLDAGAEIPEAEIPKQVQIDGYLEELEHQSRGVADVISAMAHADPAAKAQLLRSLSAQLDSAASTARVGAAIIATVARIRSGEEE